LRIRIMLVAIDDCRVRYRIVFGACHRAIRVSPQKLPSMLPLRSVSGLVIKGTAGPGLGIGPVGSRRGPIRIRFVRGRRVCNSA
jgi:hypothetical protein